MVHYSDGTWLVTDGEAETPDALTIVHVQHLLTTPFTCWARSATSLSGQEAWRDDPSQA
jgi:hypothetical protein